MSRNVSPRRNLRHREYVFFCDESLDAEAFAQITLHVERPRYRLEGRNIPVCNEEDYAASRHQLADLRLVNKSFCRSASHCLFRVIQAKLTFNPSIPEKHQPLEKLFQISCSPHASSVREVYVGFDSTFTSRPVDEDYVRDLASLLPLCLSRFPGLTALKYLGPEYYNNDREVESLAVPIPEHLMRTFTRRLEARALAVEFPEHLMRIFTNTAVKALKSVSLPALRELSLSLPVTYEFGQFFPSGISGTPIEIVVRRLRHLSLQVCDNTGPSGGVRSENIPLSAVKSKFPNPTFASQFFKFVELATNLKSLHIIGTDILNIDGVSFRHMNDLAYLYLSNVAISSENLLSLVENCKNSMIGLAFSQVELNSGKWQDILIPVSRLPSLSLCRLIGCGYSTTGKSSHLANPDLSPFPAELDTLDNLDFHALGNLQRQVSANRSKAGLEKLGDYRYLHLEPLETVKDLIDD